MGKGGMTMMRATTHRSQMRKSWMALALASVLAVGLSLGVGAEDGQADQLLPAMTVGYQSGKITAVYEKTFQIDGRTYSLTPDAVVLDDSGNQADVGMLAVTLEVQYHLKKEQNDKIDRMIVFLPR
jgi:hypothetical protein